MRYAITGVTGLLGSRLASSLVGDGHEVVGISRSPGSARERVPSITAAFEPGNAAALSGVDVVVHLAGEPVPGRWTAAKMAAIRDSRVDGTRELVQLIGSLAPPSRPSTLVLASAVGFYGDRGDEELDEGSSRGDDFLADVCVAWEAEALAAEKLGLRVVAIRFGLVLATEGGAIPQMLGPAKWGLAGPLAGGRQWWSWIHIEDAVRLFRWAAEGDYRGALGGAGGTAQQRDFAATLGRVLGRPAFLPAPGWALELVLGGFAAEVLTSKRLIPRRTLEAGFEFSFTDLEVALRDLLA